ncbi:gasdermin-C-like [Tenrec ecaudatus]|uniref:gasdermin-C-like n=1 Tax=Tenrec ecaudatus TaxID=94439 RepID=UPI003F5991B5
MPSTVEKCVKELLEKTGKGDLKPIKHLSTANKLQVFNVMFKEHETCSFFSKKIEKPAGFTILDILEDSGSSSAPETVSSKPINLHHYGGHDMQVAANVDVNRKLEVSASCETAEVQKFALQFQYTEIPKKTWTELLKRKLLEKEPSFLQQLRRKKANLYVVTAIMKLTKCTSLNAKENVKGEGKLSFPLISYLKGNFKGEGRKVPKDKMDLPEDTVIAYQRKQLVFKEDGWDILYYSTDDEEETFQDHFNLLQEEICNQMKALDSVPRKRRDTLFHSILAMLKDGEDFQNLMDLLKENCSGHLEGHGGTILNELQKNYEDPEAIPVHCILYLLEAIMVLTDIQHDLLAQSMERKILAQQRELVKSILQPNFKCARHIPFTLKPELLAALPDEELDITYGLLEECGLTMEPPNPRSTWDVEAKQPLCSLYGTLSLLQQLVDP